MTLFQELTLALAAVTAFILIYQASIALRAFKADQERRKKQGTIEFIQKIRLVWLKSRHLLGSKWGKNPLTETDLEEIYNDFEIRTVVRNMLGEFELLSVGMNAGVYDKDLLFRASGSFLIDIHFRMKRFIDKARKNNDAVYIEFSKIVAEFEERKRKEPSGLGDITYSG